MDIQNTDVKVPVQGYLSPGSSDLNTWATHKAQFGQGGMEVVKTIAERDAITDDRKVDKMVFVKDTGQWYYFDSTWKEVNFLSVDVKDNSGANRVNDVNLIEFVGATVATGDNSGKAVVTIPPTSVGINGIVVSEDNSTYAGVETLELENIEVVKKSDDTLHLKPLIEVAEFAGNYGQWFVSQLTAEWPIKLHPRADVRDGPITAVEFQLDHAGLEPIHAPSYLAYIKDTTEVVGKIGEASGHTKGTLWFDDVVVSGSPYIVVDRDNKAYGIQESDQLDPNLSGGTNYLVAFRIHMNGKAVEDGKVKIYLAKRAYNDLQSDGYLLDVNGQPMAVERFYKTGETLGALEIIGVVNAKAITEFTCHVLDSFKSDNVTITDRLDGCSGLMIQALASSRKTGEGLLQFELDTKQNLKVSSHYLGSDRMNIDWMVRNSDPLAKVNGNEDIQFSDGLVVHTYSKAQIGKMDNHLHFADDGEPLDFYFGKVFSAEETQMLLGKTVDASVTLIDKDNAFRVAMVKWTGQPDNFTTPIIASRTSNVPNFSQGWALAGDMFISEDAVSGDHNQTKTFTIPSDANNYGFIIYPEVVEEPCKLQLKSFNVDVTTPFIGYALSGVEDLKSTHLMYSEQYKKLVQDKQGYGALRYTINATEIPMPVGELREGLADIALDTRYNMVSGSRARGGEGCIKFQNEGQATISTTVRAWSEKGSGSTSGLIFWYSKVAPDGTMTKIKPSELVMAIDGGTKGMIGTLPTFTIDVKAGDMIALRAQGDADDAGFLQCVDDSKPMVSTTIKFREITP